MFYLTDILASVAKAKTPAISNIVRKFTFENHEFRQGVFY